MLPGRFYHSVLPSLLGMTLLVTPFVGGACARVHSRPLLQNEVTAGDSLYGAAEKSFAVKTATLSLSDPNRDKPLSVRVTWPDAPGPFPIIVYSHGAWGSKDGYQTLIRYWVERGYVVLQPTHPDSVQEGSRLMDKRAFLHWQVRPAQISLIIDSLTEIERQVPAVKGKMDKERIGVGGHSFGAGTTQLVAGATARTFQGKKSFSDPRPRAFILLSSQGVGGILTQDSWKGCTRPMLVMSGSKDVSPVDVAPVETRKDPYLLSPPGDKYLVWVEGLDHGYGGISGSGRWTRNPDHVAWTQTVTLAFWDTYLKSNTTARNYLQSEALPETTGNALTMTRK